MKNALSDKEDHDLIRRCIRGNTEAYCDIVKKYQSVLFNLIYHITGDCKSAAKVLEDVFLKAFEKLHTCRSRKKFYIWILNITVMECVDFLHRQERMVDLRNAGSMSDRDTPDKLLQNARETQKIDDALLKLQINDRIVVVLNHIGKLSYREISEVLDLPEKTVKSLLYSARKELSKLFINQKLTFV